MIIMASASGTLAPAIARLVASDEDTVRDMIHLFNEKGLAALDPQWAGTGAPLSITCPQRGTMRTGGTCSQCQVSSKAGRQIELAPDSTAQGGP